MQNIDQQCDLKLVLNNDYVFKIATNCRMLADINPNIYNKLINKKKYKVKLNINPNSFECFINYLTNRVTPTINDDNFDDYIQISQKFDIMKPLLDLYIRKKPSILKSLLITQNSNYLEEKKKHMNILDKYLNDYQQIIEYLFNCDHFYSFFENPENKKKVFQACKMYEVNQISDLTRKVVIQGNFEYLLNEKEKTAEIHSEIKANRNILFPRAIHYKSKEFIIKSISSEAINYNSNVKTIKFQSISELSLFKGLSLYFANIDCIVIPSSITVIKSCAFYNCRIKELKFTKDTKIKTIELGAFMHSKIKNMYIPSCIENISYDSFFNHMHFFIIKSKKVNIKASKDKNFILGKSNLSNDFFDVILFSFPCDTKAVIPSTIKIINRYSFVKNKNLQNIIFESNSILKKIDEYAFSETQIKTIKFPSSVIKICSLCFRYCKQLKTIEFLKDSKLKVIESCAFYESSLESITLPSSVEELERRWCENTKKLIDIKIVKNEKENIMLYENKYIIGKSNLSNDNYDILLFAFRNIRDAIIPSFIEKIDSCAFNNCKKLKNVWFSNNSKLKIIDEDAFSYSTLENILIPNHVTKIGAYSFQYCKNIKNFDFEKNCELKTISPNMFEYSSLKKIIIPKYVTKIGCNSFAYSSLENIKFSSNSELSIIGKSAFSYSKIKCISIPQHVILIGETFLTEIYSLEIIEFNEDIIQLPLLRNSCSNKNLKIMIPAIFHLKKTFS